MSCSLFFVNFLFTSCIYSSVYNGLIIYSNSRWNLKHVFNEHANSNVMNSGTEYFKIPKDVLVICLGKSTYARCGIIVNVTPLEPGWEGHVTLEFSNTTPLPAKIYANEGVAQLVFIKGNERPSITYAKRKGKYMKQRGVTLPKI